VVTGKVNQEQILHPKGTFGFLKQYLMFPQPTCLVWHYGLWNFQAGGTKLERSIYKNPHTQKN
jgi:hypothetical protein